MSQSLLIVEDQPAVREVVAELVSDYGNSIEIGQAGSCAEARESLTSRHWDALITDMTLGDGNMLETIAALKSEGFTVPPTVLMSGFLTSERMAQAVSLGISHVLSKPFEPRALMGCLESLFGAKKSDAGRSEARKEPLPKARNLLPEMFDMDRRLGIVYRMFDELPGGRDVGTLSARALALACDIIKASRGFIALFDRQKKRLIMVASQGLGNVPGTCELDRTPFAPLLAGQRQWIEGPVSGASCWPGENAAWQAAVSIQLQGVPMGVLCLLDEELRDPLLGETRQMLALLVRELDTLLDNRAVHAALAESMRQTLFALVRTLEARDRYTRDHSGRVSRMSVLFARAMGLDEETVDLVRTGGLLHDIGKVGIPDAVLLKPGRYTDKEYAIMKAHPGIGDAILKNMDTLVRERLIVRHHHERWDGRGYPDRIGGEEIPLEARIVCVADAIDAMTTHRVYRKARPLSFCLEQLEANAGTQFDPEVVRVAVEAIRRGEIHSQSRDELPEDAAKVSPQDLEQLRKELSHAS